MSKQNPNEQLLITSFISGHVCPDRKVHDNVKFNITLSHSHASGIGWNTYIKCNRCGCMQDATDYGEW